MTLSTRAFQAASSVLPMNLSQAPSLFSQHVEAGLDQRVGTQRGQQWARQGERRHRCLVWGLWRLRVPGSLCGSRHSAGSTRVWNLHLDKLPFSPGDCRSLKRLKLLLSGCRLPRRRHKEVTRELRGRSWGKWEGLAGNLEAAAREPFPSLREAPASESALGKNGLPAGMGASSVGGPGRPGVSRDDHVVTARGPGHMPSLGLLAVTGEVDCYGDGCRDKAQVM